MFIHDQYYIFVFGIEYPRVPGAGAEFMRWRSQTSIYIMGGLGGLLSILFLSLQYPSIPEEDAGIQASTKGEGLDCSASQKKIQQSNKHQFLIRLTHFHNRRKLFTVVNLIMMAT